MLNKETLDGIKLVDENYFASEEEVEVFLESAIAQGSQGWGVRREVGICLKLARDLKIALALAATADEAGRMLKGAQLELGRVKKQLATQIDLNDRIKRAGVEGAERLDYLLSITATDEGKFTFPDGVIYDASSALPQG